MPILSAIEETLDTLDTKITWQDISKAAGISKSALSHFKNGTELKFPHLLNVAKFVFKTDYVNVFKEWCLNLTQPKNIRYSFEYLAVNRHVNELEDLINKTLKQSSNAILTEWATAYNILLDYLKGGDVDEILVKCRLLTPKCLEMKILMALVEVYCRNKKREYSSMMSVVSGVDLYISQIKEEYIRESFSLRLKEILSYLHLYKFNEPLKAREYANEIISADMSATLTTNSYYIVGMSFLFDNYDECLGNIMKYRELLDKHGRKTDITVVDNNDIPFVNSVWNKHQCRPETNDISEISHYESVNGNKELALELINKAIEEDGESGFKLYYKALASGDKSLFMQSVIYFVSKKGDKFFANLPYKQLINDPVYKPMADLLIID
jgi:hypothetical protein